MCAICGNAVQKGYLEEHRRRVHQIVPPPHRRELAELGRDGSERYRVLFPPHAGVVQCQVAVCPGRAESPAAMRTHFCHRHEGVQVSLLEDGPQAHPPCERCGRQVHWRALLTGRHHRTAMCTEGAERKRKRELGAEARRTQEEILRSRGTPLQTVPLFRYLGRIVSYDDADWWAVERNLRRARAKWTMISKINGPLNTTIHLLFLAPC